MTVLSTKILTLPQRSLLTNANVGLVEYDAIQVSMMDFDLEKGALDIILSSKNAVNAFLDKLAHPKTQKRSDYRIYCVGEKTRAMLEKQHLEVVESGDKASELAKKLVDKHSNRNFLFLCGDKRRDELPTILKQHSVAFKELQVYKTRLCPKKFDRKFNGVLFFSPSAVVSHASLNTLAFTTAFCIGDTTGAVAREYTGSVIVANRPSIENVLVQVIKKMNINGLG
ncbi:MAG: uroporphyrinogen-III synthase [Sediminicola sp.]|tara:strand:+ start:74700 stop:75377 length:678 start_codon:yes stop_codon:yes gene_type:complete